MNSQPTVGFIGLGLMGQAMAANLLLAGFNLHIHSRTKAKAKQLIGQGARWYDHPHQLAANLRGGIIIICVSDSSALATVINNPHGLLPQLSADTLIIDMGTSRFDLTLELAKAVTEKGGHYLDAPVSGGQKGAQDANLSVMVGGTEAQLTRAMPAFNAMAASITHVGPTGCGQIAKTANQMIVGVSVGIVAEALHLAQQAGADTGQVKQALSGGFADSKILQIHGQRMVDHTFTPGARATTQLKDMQQASILAQQLGIALPLLDLSTRQWQAMVDAGQGELDQSGYLAWIERLNA
ncbi:MAG: NAD(P)-dependent oxidoreductase [Gammaproteobacteria bacterium]|nr:NAD(P)-dependent oxidoreductase [Gammaproteobacteria bacterium]MCP4880231.1 NAD(P)-dependent oxidoreductase [Gammaproteobacteria bacterium]